MRERTCWFLISPLQTIPWTWLNIWLMWLISSDLHQNKPNSLLYTTSCCLTWQQFYLRCWNSQQKRDLRAGAGDPPTLPGMETALGHIILTDQLYMHSLSNTHGPHPTSCDVHLSGLPKIFHWAIKKLDQSNARVYGLGGEETHPQQYKLSSAWCRSTRPGVTVPAGPPLWYCRARWSCEKITRKQQVVEWRKLSNRWRKEGVTGHIPYEVITDEAVPTAVSFSSALETKAAS